MGATKYRFAFGKVGDPGTFQAGQVFTTFVTFSGLTPGATYTARVARDCYPDGWSAGFRDHLDTVTSFGSGGAGSVALSKPQQRTVPSAVERL